MPVAAGVARVFHAGCVIEIHEVLHGGQAKDRYRRPHGADQIPGYAHAITVKVAAVELFFWLSNAFVPATGGVVIVGAGIDHAVYRVVVRQEGVVGPAAKGKLQDLHSG